MTVNYIHSDSMKVQGTARDVRRKYSSEWIISPLGYGGGNWLLTKKSDLLINGESSREAILDYYGKEVLTNELAKQYCREVLGVELN